MATGGRITKAGLDALRNAEPMDEDSELLLMVMANINDVINRGNVIALCNQLIEQYGNIRNAINAIHDGNVKFEKAT